MHIKDRMANLEILYWVISCVENNSTICTFHNKSTIHEILIEIKNSLLIWNKVLGLTGGGLRLEKCKRSILTWNSNYWGQQYLQVMCDKEETITIT